MNILEVLKSKLFQKKTDFKKTSCVIIGAKGEVGSALVKMAKKAGHETHEIDYDNRFDFAKKIVDFMHVCIPFTDQDAFISEVIRIGKLWVPEYVIIHSTVLPGTTDNLIKKLNDLAPNVQVAYSPCRGQHDRLYEDFLAYPKWYAVKEGCEARDKIDEHLRSLGFKTIGTTKISNLEAAKLFDTSQYGTLIMYAQIANRICQKNRWSYELVRDFMRDTHELYGVRPDIFPGYAGGHCVRQNVDLLGKFSPNKLWKLFRESNDLRKKELGISDELANKSGLKYNGVHPTENLLKRNKGKGGSNDSDN